MPPALTLQAASALIGPNVYSPFPGALLEVSAAADQQTALQIAVKDLAQAVGLVIGPPQIISNTTADYGQISLFVRCSQPALAAEICRAAVAELNAALAADESFDAGEVRWQLQRRRRRSAPPLRALQLIADARRRERLAALLPDGSLLLGSGRCALLVDSASLSGEAPVTPDWPAVGHVPVVLVSGAGRVDAAQRIAAEQQLPLLVDPPPDTVLMTLADPTCPGLVVSLSTAQLLHQGLPVSFCHAAVVCDADEPGPPGSDPTRRLDAVGLPVLVCRGPVRLGPDPQLRRLIGFAAHGHAEWPPLSATCFPPLR